MPSQAGARDHGRAGHQPGADQLAASDRTRMILVQDRLVQSVRASGFLRMIMCLLS